MDKVGNFLKASGQKVVHSCARSYVQSLAYKTKQNRTETISVDMSFLFKIKLGAGGVTISSK